MSRSSLFIVVLCAVAVDVAAAATPQISFPLGPYYRPGKYLPVHVVADAPAAAASQFARIAATADPTADPAAEERRGSITTRVSLRTGRIDAIVPWMVLSARGEHPRLSVGESTAVIVDGPPLKRLGDAERLVGWTIPPDEPFARELLHGAPKVIPVTLDPTQPIAGDPACWEMLDAIVLDAAGITRLSESQFAGLVAAGVTVAVKTDAPVPPVAGWPWKRSGGYWILRYLPAGPTTAGYHEGAYLPVASWQPGLAEPVRRQIVLIGILCTIPLLGLALWRPRRTALWAVVVAAAMGGGIGAWAKSHRAIRSAAGEIVVLGDGLTQTDAWHYRSSASAGAAVTFWNGITRPITADDIGVTLECDATGLPKEFDAQLPAGRKVAFLSRVVGTRAPRNPPSLPVTSPLAELADQLYLTDGGRIAGQLPAARPPDAIYLQWNAVVIDRRTGK